MPNHPNRGPQSSATNPKPADVVTLRECVQAKQSLNITAAQKICADIVYSTPRAWQRWETGERRMHPAFWELFKAKLNASK